MDFVKFGIKRDKYKLARGPLTKILVLFCRVCGAEVLTYQKDGPGPIRRLYFDRIFAPKKLVHLEMKRLTTIAPLRCAKCKEDLGTPYVYVKEKRKAFKVYQDALVKKSQTNP